MPRLGLPRAHFCTNVDAALLISNIAPSSLTIRDRSSIMMTSIVFTIITVLDVFDRPLLGNMAVEAVPAVKNAG